MARKVKPVPVTIVHEPIPPAEHYKEPDRFSMSIRQIENGFIVSEHGYKDGKHFDRERFESGRPAFPSRRESRSLNEKPQSRPKRAGAGRTVDSAGETKTSGFMAVDMAPPPKKAQPPSPLNVPSDAGLPRPKSRAQRLRFAKL